jgi:hypothetical protein
MLQPLPFYSRSYFFIEFQSTFAAFPQEPYGTE